MLCSYIHHVEMKAFLKTHLLSRELSTEQKESPSRNMCAKSHPSSKQVKKREIHMLVEQK